MPGSARLRTGRARIARWLVPGALAATLVVPWPAAANPACATPSIAIEGAAGGVAALRRGQEITVTGRGFVDGCGTPGTGPFPGCTGREPAAEPSPMRDLELEILGGRLTRRTTTLGTTDAGSTADGGLGVVTWTVRIPSGQAAGPAAIQVDGPRGLTIGLGVEVRQGG